MTSASLLLVSRLAVCGPLALRYVARRLGIRTDWKKIALLAGTDRRGTSLLGLKCAAIALGLQARTLRTNYPGLRILPKPLIVHMRDEHYEVVQDCEVTGVVTGGFLRRRIRRIPFIKQWSGVALVLHRDCTIRE
jgi:ABC-type bacteriocin/lantibiotic exporter with double-glycine peptidase domain